MLIKLIIADAVVHHQRDDLGREMASLISEPPSVRNVHYATLPRRLKHAGLLNEVLDTYEVTVYTTLSGSTVSEDNKEYQI